MDFNSWQWGNWEEEIVLLRDENNANRDRLQGLALHGGDGDGNGIDDGFCCGSDGGDGCTSEGAVA